MSAPLFSIITPTFQSGAKIAATAASVLAQEAGLSEFLVIDGCSRDETVDHLHALGPAVRWISEPDAGIYDAMNKGIRLASGKFLYFLGAGDRLRPGVLRAVAARLPAGARDGDSPCDFVYGDVCWPSQGGRYGGEFDASRLSRHNINHQAIFYGRGIFDRCGAYDLRYKLCADYALNIRCFGTPAVKKIHLDLVVADFEDGGASTTLDEPFFRDLPRLAWRHLGARAALRAAFFHSRRLQWARGLDYQFRNWRTLPARTWGRLSRSARAL